MDAPCPMPKNSSSNINDDEKNKSCFIKDDENNECELLFNYNEQTIGLKLYQYTKLSNCYYFKDFTLEELLNDLHLDKESFNNSDIVTLIENSIKKNGAKVIKNENGCRLQILIDINGIKKERNLFLTKNNMNDDQTIDYLFKKAKYIEKKHNEKLSEIKSKKEKLDEIKQKLNKENEDIKKEIDELTKNNLFNEI